MVLEGLTSSNGGGEGNYTGLAVWCAAITIITTLLFSILLPAAAAAEYSFEEVYAERQQLSEFTGESITGNTPWKLEAVYTPWIAGEPYNVTDSGWLYGSEISPYTLNGTNYLDQSIIRLDPTQKSSVPLYNSTEEATIRVQDDYGFFGNAGAFLLAVFSLGAINLLEPYDKDVTYPTWNFTGYRYQFSPMLPFQSGTSTVDGELSIVWYQLPGSGAEGLSGGLAIYGKDNVLLASYSAVDIIADYNTASSYSTKYTFDFEGTPVDLNIRFDPEVNSGITSAEEAWTSGKWTLAISTVSAGQFIDLANSNSYGTSLGNMVSTFIDIFTFKIPTTNPYYSAIMWLLVGLPAEMCILLFCSRFGLAGVGAGLLGSALLFLGGI